MNQSKDVVSNDGLAEGFIVCIWRAVEGLQSPNIPVISRPPGEAAGTQEIAVISKQFFQAGTKEAWIVYPEDGQVERRYADGKARWYSAEEEFDAAPLLPGFKWTLAEVLAKA